MEFQQESERLIQNMINFQCPPNFDMTKKSCRFRNQASISSYQPELDQNQILDILTSYPFSEIELKDECEYELSLVIQVQSLNQYPPLWRCLNKVTFLSQF